MLASIGPRNVELTGELAEGWLPIFLRMDALPEMRELLAAGSARSGRDAVGDRDSARDAGRGVGTRA